MNFLNFENNCAASACILSMLANGIPLGEEGVKQFIELFWKYSTKRGFPKGTAMPEEVFDDFTRECTYAVLVLQYDVIWKDNKAHEQLVGVRLYRYKKVTHTFCVRIQTYPNAPEYPMHWAPSDIFTQDQLRRISRNKENDGLTIWTPEAFDYLCKFIEHNTQPIRIPEPTPAPIPEPTPVPIPSAPIKYNCMHCEPYGGCDVDHKESDCTYSPHWR